MSDWLHDRAEQVRNQQHNKQTSEQLQLHKAGVLRAKARGLLDALTAQVQKDFERYDAEFKNEPERQVSFTAKPSGGFKLAKMHYPAVEMECSLDLPSGEIRAEYSSRSAATSATMRQTITIQLTVDANDNLQMTTANHNISHIEDASRVLVERVLFA